MSMPCDSIILNSVDLGKMDAAILADAVKAMGAQRYDAKRFYHNGSIYTIADGKLTGNERTVGQTADLLKRNYGKAAVYASAKAKGWLVREIEPFKLQVTRR
jgi:hypothetical protein